MSGSGSGSRNSRNSTGFTGVRQRPNGNYTAEITGGGVKIYLGTFLSAQEAARAYDAAAWRLGRRRQDMNFPEIRTLEEAEHVATQPQLVTNAARRQHAEHQRRLAQALADERAMEAWRREHPEDVEAERQFFRRKKIERRDARAARRLAGEDVSTSGEDMDWDWENSDDDDLWM